MGANDRDWLSLQREAWRERVEEEGREVDYVGLGKVLFIDDSPSGRDRLEEAWTLLEQGRRLFPNSISILELVIVLAARTGRASEMDEALATLSRLDPSSEVFRISREVSDQSIEEWNTAGFRLVEAAGSVDPEVAAAAVAELDSRARMFPLNSTHAIYLGLGLVRNGRREEALEVARRAVPIADDSFADAYNLGTIFHEAGDNSEARTHWTWAFERAQSPADREQARVALGRLGDPVPWSSND